jgi:hypothetical protein
VVHFKAQADISFPFFTDSILFYFIRAPSIRSLKKAMQTYARQGGTSTIFVNDDGLRVSLQLLMTERALIRSHPAPFRCRPRRTAGVLREPQHRLGRAAQARRRPRRVQARRKVQEGVEYELCTAPFAEDGEAPRGVVEATTAAE